MQNRTSSDHVEFSKCGMKVTLDFVDLNASIPFRYRCDFLSHVLERGDTVEYKYDLPSDDMVSCAYLGTHSRKTHCEQTRFIYSTACFAQMYSSTPQLFNIGDRIDKSPSLSASLYLLLMYAISSLADESGTFSRNALPMSDRIDINQSL